MTFTEHQQHRQHVHGRTMRTLWHRQERRAARDYGLDLLAYVIGALAIGGTLGGLAVYVGMHW